MSENILQIGGAIRHTPLPQISLSLSDELAIPQYDTNTLHLSYGGFVGSGELAWRTYGPTIEIIEPKTGCCKAAWTFGAILHNQTAVVTSVCGIGISAITHVIIGVDTGSNGSSKGLVGLLSLRSSRLTRTFCVPQKVTSLCMVTNGEVFVDPCTLAAPLRSCNGLLAVGMEGGHVYLIDLAFDLGADDVLSDELSPAMLTQLNLIDGCLERRSKDNSQKYKHLCINLQGSTVIDGNFYLYGPYDNTVFESSADVEVSVLHFVPQIASLIYDEDSPPVISIAYQEPENDPKNFVYLWICRSYNAPEVECKVNAFLPARCSMYGMHYTKKEWIEGHGLWHQGFASCSTRFEFEAVGGIGHSGEPATHSSIFVGATVRSATPSVSSSHSSSVSPINGIPAVSSPDEDGGSVPELSLCMFGWISGVIEHGLVSLEHNLAVFDINQWYQSQMPLCLVMNNKSLCPYMSFYKLDKVPKGLCEKVLAASPIAASWVRHQSFSSMENDWFPSSLSFDLHLLTSGSVVMYHCSSVQQSVLNKLVQAGPMAIVKPAEPVRLSCFAGLISSDSVIHTTERELLLNMALEQQLTSLLISCIHEFAEGHFAHLGCSSEYMMDWAWSRLLSVKASVDYLSSMLFGAEDGAFSKESMVQLQQNLSALTALNSIFGAIHDTAYNCTIQSKVEVESRAQVCSLLLVHLQCTIWFYSCGLLPQLSKESMDDFYVPFPSEILEKIYSNRRKEIMGLSSSLTGSEVLLIDGLMETVNPAVGNLWAEDGNSSFYPASSLRSLLAMYLIPGISTATKHRIVQYFFLDLASLLNDSVVEELVKFPASFALQPSLIKLTQGFWLLDHKDFQEALNILLDPLINPSDITIDQHRRIIKAFLYQNESSHALVYYNAHKPPKENFNDIRLHLTVLLANGLIREAFHYQQNHRVRSNAQDLLSHFFTGCEHMGKLEAVLSLPLSTLEENAFIAFLKTSAYPASVDLLVVFYLQRKRYAEAALLQEGPKFVLGSNKKRQAARSALVQGYITHLPHQDTLKMDNKPKQFLYTKPQPLSVNIRMAASGLLRPYTAVFYENESEDSWEKSKGGVYFTPFKSSQQRCKRLLDNDADNSSQKKRKIIGQDIPRVILPKFLESTINSEKLDDLSFLSPSTQNMVNDPAVSLQNEVSLLMQSVLFKTPIQESRRSLNISSEVMSVLKMPIPVTPKSPKLTADTTLPDTPQSILKVCCTVNQPLNSSISDSPVYPRIRSEKKNSFNVSKDLMETSLTPKQLRFDLHNLQSSSPAEIDEEKLDDIQFSASEDKNVDNKLPESTLLNGSLCDAKMPSDSDSALSDIDAAHSPMEEDLEEQNESFMSFQYDEDERGFEKSTEVEERFDDEIGTVSNLEQVDKSHLIAEKGKTCEDGTNNQLNVAAHIQLEESVKLNVQEYESHCVIEVDDFRKPALEQGVFAQELLAVDGFHNIENSSKQTKVAEQHTKKIFAVNTQSSHHTLEEDNRSYISQSESITFNSTNIEKGKISSISDSNENMSNSLSEIEGTTNFIQQSCINVDLADRCLNESEYIPPLELSGLSEKEEEIGNNLLVTEKTKTDSILNHDTKVLADQADVRVDNIAVLQADVAHELNESEYIPPLELSVVSEEEKDGSILAEGCTSKIQPALPSHLIQSLNKNNDTGDFSSSNCATIKDSPVEFAADITEHNSVESYSKDCKQKEAYAESVSIEGVLAEEIKPSSLPDKCYGERLIEKGFEYISGTNENISRVLTQYKIDCEVAHESPLKICLGDSDMNEMLKNKSPLPSESSTTSVRKAGRRSSTKSRLSTPIRKSRRLSGIVPEEVKMSLVLNKDFMEESTAVSDNHNDDASSNDEQLSKISTPKKVDYETDDYISPLKIYLSESDVDRTPEKSSLPLLIESSVMSSTKTRKRSTCAKSRLCTPIRRSRRLSEIVSEEVGELVNSNKDFSELSAAASTNQNNETLVKVNTPSTPVHKAHVSGYASGKVMLGTPTLDLCSEDLSKLNTPVTPSRRSRQLSGSSVGSNSSLILTPTRRSRRLSGLEPENAELLSPKVKSKIDSVTPVKKELLSLHLPGTPLSNQKNKLSPVKEAEVDESTSLEINAKRVINVDSSGFHHVSLLNQNKSKEKIKHVCTPPPTKYSPSVRKCGKHKSISNLLNTIEENTETNGNIFEFVGSKVSESSFNPLSEPLLPVEEENECLSLTSFVNDDSPEGMSVEAKVEESLIGSTRTVYGNEDDTQLELLPPDEEKKTLSVVQVKRQCSVLFGGKKTVAGQEFSDNGELSEIETEPEEGRLDIQEELEISSEEGEDEEERDEPELIIQSSVVDSPQVSLNLLDVRENKKFEECMKQGFPRRKQRSKLFQGMKFALIKPGDFDFRDDKRHSPRRHKKRKTFVDDNQQETSSKELKYSDPNDFILPSTSGTKKADNSKEDFSSAKEQSHSKQQMKRKLTKGKKLKR